MQNFFFCFFNCQHKLQKDEKHICGSHYSSKRQRATHITCTACSFVSCWITDTFTFDSGKKCPAVNQTMNVNQFHKTQFGKRSWSTNGSKSCKENRSGGKRVRCPEASQRTSALEEYIKKTTNRCMIMNWNSFSCRSLYFRLKQLLMLSFSSVFIFKTHPLYPVCRQNSVPQTFGALQRLC